jgi:hypothetical protein
MFGKEGTVCSRAESKPSLRIPLAAWITYSIITSRSHAKSHVRNGMNFRVGAPVLACLCGSSRQRLHHVHSNQSFPPSLLLIQSPRHAADIRSPFYLILVSEFFVRLIYTLSIHSPSPIPPRSPLLYKPWASPTGSAHVYKTALLHFGEEHREYLSRVQS